MYKRQGQDGVDKRIDTIASVIHMKGTIYDLEELELAYAPPFSSAKDPVNMLGFVAENVINHLAVSYTHLDVYKRQPVICVSSRGRRSERDRIR